MVKTVLQVKVAQFFSQFGQREYKKGEFILQPDEAHGVFFLETGHVREYGISSQGIEVGLHIFVPNTYFPMMWVIANIPNRYYYEALDDVRVYNAPKEAVLLFLKENPDVLFDLTKRAFMGLDKLTSRIEHLSYGKAYEKVVSIILYLARHFGEEKDMKVYIDHKFTHRDIAALAGITRETTSREWEKLEKKELINYKEHLIIIENLEKLKQELV